MEVAESVEDVASVDAADGAEGGVDAESGGTGDADRVVEVAGAGIGVEPAGAECAGTAAGSGDLGE